ncbi:hypothetical protein B0H13DRAFT_2013145 [Mycena leptocephala]|nr:hypothetical protein B0H13DRAFT_2013145 [Mycena leptocephala]
MGPSEWSAGPRMDSASDSTTEYATLSFANPRLMRDALDREVMETDEDTWSVTAVVGFFCPGVNTIADVQQAPSRRGNTSSFTSTTSLNRPPLPPRPDWAVGLRPNPSLKTFPSGINPPPTSPEPENENEDSSADVLPMSLPRAKRQRRRRRRGAQSRTSVAGRTASDARVEDGVGREEFGVPVEREVDVENEQEKVEESENVPEKEKEKSEVNSSTYSLVWIHLLMNSAGAF